MGKRLNTEEAAKALATADHSAFQMRGRLLRGVAAKYVLPARKVGRGDHAPWEFDYSAILAAAVLFELIDVAGITDAFRLGVASDLLLTKEDSDTPLVERALADAAMDGTPLLIVTVWRHPTEKPFTGFEVRLTHELDEPIRAPGEGWIPAMDGFLSLAPILDRFITSPVVSTPEGMQ